MATGASAVGQSPHDFSRGVTTSSLGAYSPTFVGPAATGCASNCNLLSGPISTPSTANLPATTSSSGGANAPVSAAAIRSSFRALPSPVLTRGGPDPTPPTVNCPNGSGCDSVSLNPGGANGVNGLNAVDSGTLSTNGAGDIEPSDQGLCAGNGYVVESNNIGEILVFNQNLHRVSSVISLDTLMGLTGLGYSSGGDISCAYDSSNGGHWFFTEIVSESPESSGGPFGGCFVGVPGTCYEGIAVTKGSNPFGPYNVYFLNANYNPAEPGAPYLLNDFAKIATSRDAFLLFYDEFPLTGGFNGAQEFAFNKNAMEFGLPVTLHNGSPNPFFSVAIENMGNIATPDGSCATGGPCWYSVIPTEPPDGSQFDNGHGGSAFMMATLDFNGAGDTRIAAFDWTGLANLNSPGCFTCGGIHFGGQLFSGVEYYYGEGTQGFWGAQKSGPIPLGDYCGALGLSSAVASCPEGGIATNGDNVTQAAQAQGELWTAVSTAVTQRFGHSGTEVHQGAAYWVLGTNGFDRGGSLSLDSQGYVSAAHEDLEMPAMAAGDNSGALMDFTLSGNGGPTGADHGGFYPSTAWTLIGGNGNGFGFGEGSSQIHVADLGQAPQDGFSEYDGYTPSGFEPGTGPRWGDYSAAVYANGQFYFATEFIQSPNCSDTTFLSTNGTCGGTRDPYANWGTSVNSVSLHN